MMVLQLIASQLNRQISKSPHPSNPYFYAPMSLYISSLNSGSNGNCYYIGNDREAVLVDAGISCRETEKRMKRLGTSIDKVKAVFISHEHSDHIRGLAGISKKHRLPVYISNNTYRAGGFYLEKERVINFSNHETVKIGAISVTAFSKLHDALDPYSFLIECEGIKVGVFTDIGRSCQNVIRYFRECHAAFLESNYDEEMLSNGTYPD
jgi:phosphoribosyl 1,2-cyclic phosphodiesterase